MPDPLVSVENVSKTYEAGFLSRRPRVHALQDVSFAIERGEAFGIVGESGSGKSTLGRIILGLLPASGGVVRVRGQTVTGRSQRRLRPLRRYMQMVFQDPYSSLDPLRRVGDQIADPLRVHGPVPGETIEQTTTRLLESVGLDAGCARRAPSSFSGGQRQRIAIARALATQPELVIADEAVSALDVMVQVQILELLADLRRRTGMTLLFISHDLEVVRYLCDRVCVMQHGRIVECGPTERVFAAPAHAYTAELLAASPRLTPRAVAADRDSLRPSDSR